MVIKILSYIKSLFFCLRRFKFSVAIKIPVLIGFHTKVNVSRTSRIILSGKIHRAMLSIGNGGSAGVPTCKDSNFIMSKNAQLIINESCSFGEGVNIRIDSGILKIGQEVYFNKNSCIYCSSSIEIGDKCVFGWNNTLFDGTGHFLFCDGKEKSNIEPIKIGSSVWSASFVTWLKGSAILSGGGCRLWNTGYKTIFGGRDFALRCSSKNCKD